MRGSPGRGLLDGAPPLPPGEGATPSVPPVGAGHDSAGKRALSCPPSLADWENLGQACLPEKPPHALSNAVGSPRNGIPPGRGLRRWASLSPRRCPRGKSQIRGWLFGRRPPCLPWKQPDAGGKRALFGCPRCPRGRGQTRVAEGRSLAVALPAPVEQKPDASGKRARDANLPYPCV